MSDLYEIHFFVSCKIVGKQRPKFRRYKSKGKEFIGTYTPAKTQSFEKLIADEYRQRYTEMAFPDADTPLQISMSFVFAMPKSWSEKKRVIMAGRPCMKKPDLDNCMKSVMDGLSGVAYPDDKQITDDGGTMKRWGTVEGVSITIRKVECRRW